MKKYKYIILTFCTILLFVGCNNWLDVQPRTQKKKELMFDSEQGFREVLVGAYMRLKSPSLYGGDLSWGAIENLAQHWETNTGVSQSMSNYKFKEAEEDIAAIYFGLYATISDVNSILEVIDEKQALLPNDSYELIKGEALAMRAYCHFNVLQLFGPIPGSEDGKRILSYVKTVTTDVHQSYSFKDFTNLLIADLDEAERLMKDRDLICKYSMYDLNHLSISGLGNTTDDDFWFYRQHRMNYFSVIGQKARVYHWTGNKEKAAEYAMQIIDAKDSKGELMYSLGGASSLSKKDNILSCEHILNVHVFNLGEIVESNFSPAGRYSIECWKIDELFPTGTSDIRKKLWGLSDNSSSTRYISKKYDQQITLYEPACVVPMMRISEMYLIAMECGTIENAQKLYTKYCLVKDILAEQIVDKQQLQSILLTEYNREFYAEGKLFYTYKRLGIPCSKILWKPFTDEKSTNEIYILPLPKREIILN